MIVNSPTSIEIKNKLLEGLRDEDSETKVSVRKSSLGWIEIQVVTVEFEKVSQVEREARIDTILEPIGLNLGQYPITEYRLLTPAESQDKSVANLQLPLWSDILMAPESGGQRVADRDEPSRPQIVTFYSFKGGVGRSTALGIVAILLAQRNRKVVVIDFDLEAPGISVLLNRNSENQCGVLDYIHQRFLTPEENIPSIEDCVRQVELSSRGELFIVSAGEYNESYVHRLAELDRRAWETFYKRERNPINQLIEDIKEYLDPDLILIDARPGFNDTGAVALLHLADTGVICFSPTDQSFDGLRWVVQAARKQFDYRDKPDLRFLLTPMPILSEDQLGSWISRTEDWIIDHWGLPNDVSANELYHKIFYNPAIAALSCLVDIPENLTSEYLPISNTIDASLPETQLADHAFDSNQHRTILNELRFQAATAQELQIDKIPAIFQRTEDFPKFIRDRIWLIRGAKGTGKSILFRLFSEISDRARELSRDDTDLDLKNYQFIAGHGQSRLRNSILDSQSLASFEQEVGEDSWAIFWLNYVLLQLCVSCSELSTLPGLDNELIQLSQSESLTQSAIVDWLVKRVNSPRAIPQASDELISIDAWLSENHRNIWVLYDELDAGFGSGAESYARRRRALEALLAWWLDSGTALRKITPKIFLREDIWNDLNFVNKGHYTGRSLQLKWEETDLWRLVLRQSLQSSENLRSVLGQALGLTIESLESAGLEQLRKGLYRLWGERMGRGKKAYTHNWVRTRIADTNNNCFPRSLILLLQQAVEKEKNFPTEYNSEIVLRPKALIDAFPYVSEQRVDEVRNEYPELGELLEKMEGERSPIDEDKLMQIWGAKEGDISLKIKNMKEAGILKERSRSQNLPLQVYTVTELYLYGLKMTRKGQR